MAMKGNSAFPKVPSDCLVSLSDCLVSPSDCLVSLSDCLVSPSDCLVSLSDCLVSPSDCLVSLSDCLVSPSDCLVSLSDCLVSYPGHSLGESYLSVEKQSVYSTASADWAKADGNIIYICVYINKEHWLSLGLVVKVKNKINPKCSNKIKRDSWTYTP